MPNSWFQFKQFRINQERSAMKVGTDGVLLGAWTNLNGIKHIVDMGCGTGLVALMLAQRSKARIDGIEINQNAASQAAENFASSPWPERLNSICGDIKQVCKLLEGEFDLAVCNPPFFPGHVKPPEENRSYARHINANDWILWFNAAFEMTTSTGKAVFILPFENISERIKTADQSGFYPEAILNIRPKPGKEFKRCIVQFSKQKTEMIHHELTIETGERGIYTDEFKTLVKDFYLKL